MFDITELDNKFFNRESLEVVESFNKMDAVTQDVCEELHLFKGSIELCVNIAEQTEKFLSRTSLDLTNPRSIKTCTDVEMLIEETLTYAFDCYHQKINGLLAK